MFVPNVKILGAEVPEKSLTNFPLHYTGVRDGKKERSQKKSKEISALCFSFIQDTSTVCRCIQNLKTGSVRS